MVLSLPRIEPAVGECLEYYHRGVCVPKGVPRQVFEELESFQVRQDDIYLITYPKAGTTWMQQIISLIMDGLEAELHKKVHVFFRFPFLENTWISHYSQVGLIPPTHSLLPKMPCDTPRKIKTHLAPIFLPRQIFEKKPKVVYVARNPKDVAVSYYHMHQFDTTLQTYPSWEKFFERFINKDVCGGDWFEHNLFWWKKRHDSNVLFIKYEDMKKDLKSAVQLTADFLERPVTQKDIQKIVEKCSFQNMKKDPTANPDMVLEFGSDCEVLNQPPKEKMVSFMRKGQVGDWKKYFSVAQNELFDELYQKEVMGSELSFDFQ
ncbi:sulfotransferase 1A1-like isoform X2 [Acanthaster planci]|nr:sulfotransferase 1A1-like isoform X2 [Acanthaster planci]XP_022109826.1 sulfotransferase 1A1-like isoform X2 [Acanthaster planci]XP_022109827.1 sulfotransferase 1A1-like isoform X2 [Acanthaster planci]